MDYNYTFKVIVLGDVAVGKTSLITRFSKRTHRVEYDPTTETEITFVKLQATNISITLKIYDTVGGTQDPNRLSAMASDANGFIIVYEIDRDSSYLSVDRYYEQILPYVNESTVLVLVGNKIDIKSRNISSDQAREKAARLKMEYFETSAKVGSNVDAVFSYILRELIRHRVEELNRKLEGFKENDLNESLRAAMEEAGNDPFEAAARALKIAKCNDVNASRRILVCVPKLDDNAKRLAAASKVETVESYSLQDASVKLFYMLSQQAAVLPSNAIKDEIKNLTGILGQMVRN